VIPELPDEDPEPALELLELLELLGPPAAACEEDFAAGAAALAEGVGVAVAVGVGVAVELAEESEDAGAAAGVAAGGVSALAPTCRPTATAATDPAPARNAAVFFMNPYPLNPAASRAD
jgi:hypothetical protein